MTVWKDFPLALSWCTPFLSSAYVVSTGPTSRKFFHSFILYPIFQASYWLRPYQQEPVVLQYNCTLVKSESGSESKRYKEILREGFKKKKSRYQIRLRPQFLAAVHSDFQTWLSSTTHQNMPRTAAQSPNLVEKDPIQQRASRYRSPSTSNRDNKIELL